MSERVVELENIKWEMGGRIGKKVEGEWGGEIGTEMLHRIKELDQNCRRVRKKKYLKIRLGSKFGE